MSKYNSKEFIERISAIIKKDIPDCPFCGGKRFTTTGEFGAILTGEDLSNLNLGPHIPTGMVICEKCGHIDFFALGALGLLRKEEKKDGENANN